MFKLFTFAALSTLLLSTTACVTRSKQGSGEETMHIHTPVGGLEVHTNNLSPANLGLPAYPGAILTHLPHNNDNSADVDMSFAGWRLRVQVLNYQSSNSRNTIAAFYKQALARYGDVVTCQNNKAIGEPIKTKDGLTCNNDYNYNISLDANSHANRNALKNLAEVSNTASLEMRAGSPGNQHLVVFDPSLPKTVTTFVLMHVQVPHP